MKTIHERCKEAISAYDAPVFPINPCADPSCEFKSNIVCTGCQKRKENAHKEIIQIVRDLAVEDPPKPNKQVEQETMQICCEAVCRLCAMGDVPEANANGEWRHGKSDICEATEIRFVFACINRLEEVSE